LSATPMNNPPNDPPTMTMFFGCVGDMLMVQFLEGLEVVCMISFR
jgi:hypothetical protein